MSAGIDGEINEVFSECVRTTNRSFDRQQPRPIGTSMTAQPLSTSEEGWRHESSALLTLLHHHAGVRGPACASRAHPPAHSKTITVDRDALIHLLWTMRVWSRRFRQAGQVKIPMAAVLHELGAGARLEPDPGVGAAAPSSG